MLYPGLKEPAGRVTVNRAFGGYDHNPGAGENVFYECDNLSEEAFPFIEPRKQGALWQVSSTDKTGKEITIKEFPYGPNGISCAVNAGGSFCYCGGNSFYADGREVKNLRLDMGVMKRDIIGIGRDIFISPDGKYLQYKDRDYKVTHVRNHFFAREKLNIHYYDGKGYRIYPRYIGKLPEKASLGESAVSWEEGSSQMYFFSYLESGGALQWLKRYPVYMKFICPGINEGFAPGDVIHTDGYPEEEYISHVPVQTHKIVETGENYLLTDGILIGDYEGLATAIDKKMPRLDFAAEHNNRIWGCRYGKNENNVFVNEIYCSALGRPDEWYTFEGLSTDSFSASLGCTGKFTGIGKISGSVVFFKEDYIIRVGGNSPEDFTVEVLPARGVQEGSARSVQNLNEKLFYKSSDGIMVYDGNLPVSISEALGNEKYYDGAAGCIDGKYYIAMTDSKGKRNLFVFNTATGLWFRYSDPDNIRMMVNFGGCLFFVCNVRDGYYMHIAQKFYTFRINDASVSPLPDIMKNGDYKSFSYEKEAPPLWYGITGVSDAGKGKDGEILRKIAVSLSLGDGALFSLCIKSDSDTEWQELCNTGKKAEGTFIIPVNTPPLCYYRLKFSGRGECRINAVTRYTEKSGEVKKLG